MTDYVENDAYIESTPLAQICDIRAVYKASENRLTQPATVTEPCSIPVSSTPSFRVTFVTFTKKRLRPECLGKTALDALKYPYGA